MRPDSMKLSDWKTLNDVPANIQQLYRDNNWQCSVPPVSTANWDDLSWIKHIFGHLCDKDEQ